MNTEKQWYQCTWCKNIQSQDNQCNTCNKRGTMEKESMQIQNKTHEEYYEEAIDSTMKYISEYLLSINPDYHSKYLSHVRRKIFELKEIEN